MPYTRQTVEHVMRYVFERCHLMRGEGQKEYAHAEDRPFRNFETIANELDLTPMKVLWVYTKKHIDGVIAFIKGHRSQRENIRGRIYDLIVYLVILHAMVDEEEGFVYELQAPVADGEPSFLRRRDPESGKVEQFILF